MAAQRTSVSFDSDTSSVICDNSANIHFCNNQNMFVSNIQPLQSHAVATIGGNTNVASRVGDIKWRWKDNHGHKHSYLVCNVLFFPKYPINILSITEFANQLHNDNCTGITMYCWEAIFFWDNKKYSQTLVHPALNLPEMVINKGFSLHSFWTKLVGQRVSTMKHNCHCSSLEYQQDQDLNSTSNKSNNTANDIAKSIFHVGEMLLYCREGHTTLAKVKKILLDNKNHLKICIMTAAGDELTTTKKCLRNPENLDIAWIPSTVLNITDAIKNLSEKEIASVKNPIKLSPIQEEFVSLHKQLWHLSYAIMFCLCKAGFLPKKFLKLQNSYPPCVSCMFGQAHRKPWCFKSSIDGKESVLHGPALSRLGQTISANQLISAQPDLVLQERGSLTRACIRAATVFVDYFTKYVYVSLMADQTAETTLGQTCL